MGKKNKSRKKQEASSTKQDDATDDPKHVFDMPVSRTPSPPQSSESPNTPSRESAVIDLETVNEQPITHQSTSSATSDHDSSFVTGTDGLRQKAAQSQSLSFSTSDLEKSISQAPVIELSSDTTDHAAALHSSDGTLSSEETANLVDEIVDSVKQDDVGRLAETPINGTVTHLKSAEQASELFQHNSVVESPIGFAMQYHTDPDVEIKSGDGLNDIDSSATPKTLDEDNNSLTQTVEDLQHRIEHLSEEKAQVESQYRSLFAKVTQMKTTLGARLKQDSDELAQNRTTIEELELQNASLNEMVHHMQDQVLAASDSSAVKRLDMENIQAECTRLKKQVADLTSSVDAERQIREQLEERNMMATAEWDNLAIEERSARDVLRDRINDLEEQLSAQNSAYENLRSIVAQDNQAMTRYKQTLYELQETHEAHLRTTTESLQQSIDDLTKDKVTMEQETSFMRNHTENLSRDLERCKGYEQEVKEKTLLIGKLRHEAVILNEHLTKALRLLKRGSSNDSVDRQLLNNLLLSFFQLPRQDSKRFEVLKVLSSVLNWDDVQKEQAGLLRPGSTLMTLGPLSPSSAKSSPSSPNLQRSAFSRRTSSAIQLQAADFIGPNKESMSDLWINFLESEAAMNAASKAEDY